MSPEQCRGLNDEVDGSTDIYALGCILFEMLVRARAVHLAGVGRRPDDAHVATRFRCRARRTRACRRRSIRSSRPRSRRRRRIGSRSMRDMNRALAQARNACPGHAGADDEDRPGAARRRDRGRWAALVGSVAHRRMGGARPPRMRSACATRSTLPPRRRTAFDHRGRGRHRARRRRRHHARRCGGRAPARNRRAAVAAPAPTPVRSRRGRGRRQPAESAGGGCRSRRRRRRRRSRWPRRSPDGKAVAKAKAAKAHQPVRQEKRSGQVVSFRVSA